MGKLDLLKYMFKEIVSKQTLKYLTFAFGFALFIGSAIYVSSVGVIYIFHVYNIPIGDKIVNYFSVCLGSNIVSRTIKGIIKEQYLFAE